MVGGGRIDVTAAGPDRLAALAPVFGHAFVDDPMMGWTLGNATRSPDRFTPFFAAFLEQVLGQGAVWEAGAAHGAAVWIPPGQFEEWTDHPWNHPRILQLTDDGGRRYDAFWRWIDLHGPEEPRWLLDSLAVEPAVQGRGYGTALIAAGLEWARSDGLGAHLSTGTERNVAIYRRLGFHVVEDLDAPESGPHIWFMEWDP
jgi:GNAT superfamily N-acetyltransferase